MDRNRQSQEALTALEDLGLVRRGVESDAAFLFKHVLIQNAVYDSMLRADRRRLHRLIGDICSSLYAQELDDYALMLADHYAEAGENERASQFLIRYGEHASRMSAYPEAIAAFERAVALLAQDAFAPRSRVLVQLGDIYCRRSSFTKANQTLERALADAQEAQDPSTAASAWSGLARVATQQGDHTRARELGERALEGALATNNNEAKARAHRQLGISYNFDGNNTLAEEHLVAALELYRELGDADGTGGALNSLGVVLREKNELERAWGYFQEALVLSEQRGDKYSSGVRLNNLGVIAEQRGEIETAERFQEQAFAIAVEIGDEAGAALCELNLGSLALTRGKTTLALVHFQHAIKETFALDAIPYLLYAIAAFAKWEVAMGNLERGAELLGLAFEHPSATEDIRIDFSPVLTQLESVFSAKQLASALERGRRLELEETVSEILERNES